MPGRNLLITGKEFRWGYPSSNYFSYENAKPSLGLIGALCGLLLIPILLNSAIRVLRRSNVINLKFFRLYMSFLNMMDHRILHTSFSITDAFFVFVWAFINLAFTNPRDYPSQIGYLIVCNTALITLPVYRNSVFVLLLSLPFERALKYHRWLGRGLLIITTIHMVGYWDRWIRDGTFGTQFASIPNIFAHLAWLSLVVLTVTSIEYLRRNFFEAFYYSHFCFIFYYIFAISHFPPLLPFALPGLILYFFDRLIRKIRSRPRNSDVSIVSDGSITRIKGRRYGILNYECGQYAFINIPEISKFEWHPISFTSAPSDPSFLFYIKSFGSWSRSVSKLHGKSPQINIDGPYGMLTHDVTQYDVVVMCCGGIGVTPMISILRDLHYKMSVKLLDAKKVYLFWTMRDPSLYYSLGDCFNDVLVSPMSSCFNLSVWITQAGEASPLFERGKPDWMEIFSALKTLHDDVDRIAVLSCGPTNLVNTTWDCSTRLSDSRVAFDFHKETFEF